jgi:hypothetical protein
LSKLLSAVVGCAALLTAAACGLPGVGTNAPPVQHRTFVIHVTGTHADVTQLTAYEGDTITLTVYADKSEEIHLHEYDLHFYPAPGKPATMTFKANITGTHEYEIEATSQHLGNLIVQPR